MYALTKENIRKLLKEIAASRKRKRIQEQEKGKGKRKIIITESSKYEDELAATAVDIIEDAVANKIRWKHSSINLLKWEQRRAIEKGEKHKYLNDRECC